MLPCVLTKLYNAVSQVALVGVVSLAVLSAGELDAHSLHHAVRTVLSKQVTYAMLSHTFRCLHSDQPTCVRHKHIVTRHQYFTSSNPHMVTPSYRNIRQLIVVILVINRSLRSVRSPERRSSANQARSTTKTDLEASTPTSRCRHVLRRSTAAKLVTTRWRSRI